MKKLIVILVSIYSVFTTNLMAQVPNYVPTNGLVAWYPFTGNAIDSSGNGNNGTVNGATLSTDRFGNANKAYSFDAFSWGWGSGGDYIYIPYDTSFNSPNITISAWFKKSSSYISNQSGPSIINRFEYGYNNPNGQAWGIHLSTIDDSLRTFILPPNTTNNYTLTLSQISSKVSDSNWHNAVLSFDGLNMRTYYDGVLVKTTPSNGMTLNTNGNSGISIGMSLQANGNWNPFNGSIDDIGIWNRALTNQEIINLYNLCKKDISISPQINAVNIGNTTTFTASVSDPNPSYIWQSNLGQGFQTLNNVGQYSGTSANTMSISNVQLSNHMVPIRAISTSGSCKDTSNIAYIKITDTCITKVTKYDTITTKITKYDTIKVMDTLVINANLSGISAPNNTNRIIVYPNPAKDHITIDYGVFSRMSGYTVKITNTLGQTVFSSPINQQSSFINLSSWKGKGLYYLQIIDPNSNMIENRKIVLQ